MIVTAAELELVEAGKRTLILLPVERGAGGERLPCPVEAEQFVKLQTELFEKGTGVTVLEVKRCRAEHLTAADVRALGETGVFWDGTPEVWAVRLALGNWTAFFNQHRERYLNAKGVGTTTDPKRAARGEPAVTTEEELKLAHKARERRDLEDHQAWLLSKQQIETAIAALRERGGDSEFEGDLRFLERRLAKMDRRYGEQAA